MLETGYVEAAFHSPERYQVQGRQIAGGVVEKIVFRARVGCVDPAAFGAGVPLVDRRVELQPRIGRGPGGVADAVPQLTRRQCLGDPAVGAANQVPRTISADAFEEVVGDPY